MKTNYKCKDNGVYLQFHTEDNEIDEVLVGINKTKWIIVGYKDFLNGVKKTKKKLNKLNKLNKIK